MAPSGFQNTTTKFWIRPSRFPILFSLAVVYVYFL